MTEKDINQIAHRVVEIMRNQQVETNDTMFVAPTKPPFNEELMGDVAMKCQGIITENLFTDEEQFMATSRLRDLMSKHWDQQLQASNELSNTSQNRANALGKFIELTISR